MIITAWWLRTSSRFTWEDVKRQPESLENGQLLSGCRFVPSADSYQRWSPRGRPWPRGHTLKSLALASKVKSLALASRPQVLENWPVLGSRTALVFELLKFCGALEKFFGKRVFVETA